MEKDTNPKDAIGTAKWRQFMTVPRQVMWEVGVAMLEGALKYGRHNYRASGVRASVYLDAAYGHLDQFVEGEDLDKDSGLSHVTKAITSLVVLRDAMMNDFWVDDRPPAIKDLEGARDRLQALVAENFERYADKKPRHYTQADGAPYTDAMPVGNYEGEQEVVAPLDPFVSEGAPIRTMSLNKGETVILLENAGVYHVGTEFIVDDCAFSHFGEKSYYLSRPDGTPTGAWSHKLFKRAATQKLSAPIKSLALEPGDQVVLKQKVGNNNVGDVFVVKSVSTRIELLHLNGTYAGNWQNATFEKLKPEDRQPLGFHSPYLEQFAAYSVPLSDPHYLPGKLDVLGDVDPSYLARLDKKSSSYHSDKIIEGLARADFDLLVEQEAAVIGAPFEKRHDYDAVLRRVLLRVMGQRKRWVRLDTEDGYSFVLVTRLTDAQLDVIEPGVKVTPLSA